MEDNRKQTHHHLNTITVGKIKDNNETRLVFVLENRGREAERESEKIECERFSD